MFIFHLTDPIKLNFGFYLWNHFNSINSLFFWSGIIILSILVLTKLILNANKSELTLLLFSLIVIFYFNVYQSYNFVFEYHYYKTIGNRVNKCVKEYKSKYGKYPEKLTDLDPECLAEYKLDVKRLNTKIEIIIFTKERLNRGYKEEIFFEDQYNILIKDSIFGVGVLELNKDKTDFIINQGS